MKLTQALVEAFVGFIPLLLTWIFHDLFFHPTTVAENLHQSAFPYTLRTKNERHPLDGNHPCVL